MPGLSLHSVAQAPMSATHLQSLSRYNSLPPVTGREVRVPWAQARHRRLAEE